jgi:hypothetical protein
MGCKKLERLPDLVKPRMRGWGGRLSEGERVEPGVLDGWWVVMGG